jgi:hypothetical protein
LRWNIADKAAERLGSTRRCAPIVQERTTANHTTGHHRLALHRLS